MKYLVMLLFLLYSCVATAQENKRGYNWALGFAPTVRFDFNAGLAISQMSVLAGATTTSSISNTNGIFQFYSITYSLMNIDGSQMENGDSINCPGGGKMAAYYGWGSLYPQHDIIIPKSGNQYYVFATGMSDTNWTKWKGGLGFDGWDYLNYSVVDMDSNNGMGKVILKNQVILDSQSYDNCAMSAVRHGNGKDWWLVKEDYRKHAYQIFRITSDSIIGPTYQYVPINERGNFWTQSSVIEFSKDGTKMANNMYSEMIDSSTSPPLWEVNRVDVFDFDRCTGNLTYRQKYIVPTIYDTDSIPPQMAPDERRGVCFSSDGKLLYLSTFYSVYQIDLNDTAVHGAFKVRGVDSISDMHNTMALAPDGKIYIGNFNGFQSMSTIDNPNVKGLGCNFNLNSVSQNFTYLQSPPNMPNYGLVSEVCWPASIAPSPNGAGWGEVVVYPNPASTILYIQSKKNEQAKKELYNSLGQVVLSTTKNELDISQLSAGLYYLRVGEFTKKVVKE